MRALLYGILSLAALTTLGICIWAGSGNLSAAVVAINAWAVSPYLGLMALVAWGARTRIALGIVAAGTVILAGVALLATIDGFFIHTDAQSALLLLFVPFYQRVGTIAVGAAQALASLVWGKSR